MKLSKKEKKKRAFFGRPCLVSESYTCLSLPSVLTTWSVCIVAGQGYVQLDYAMRNVTKYRTQPVRLRCEITGSPIPSYVWFKNNTPLNDGDEGGRISIRRTTWGSRYVEHQANSVCLHACLSVCLSVYLSLAGLLLCLHACLSVCLSVYLSLAGLLTLSPCLSVCQSAYLWLACYSISMLVCLSLAD